MGEGWGEDEYNAISTAYIPLPFVPSRQGRGNLTFYEAIFFWHRRTCGTFTFLTYNVHKYITMRPLNFFLLCHSRPPECIGGSSTRPACHCEPARLPSLHVIASPQWIGRARRPGARASRSGSGNQVITNSCLCVLCALHGKLYFLRINQLWWSRKKSKTPAFVIPAKAGIQ